MPLLGFTKFKEKILDGTKTQTIRKPRKRSIKVGDKLYIYWKLRTKDCMLLGEGIVTSIVRKRLVDIDNEDAVKDGFKNMEDFDKRFHAEMHPELGMFDEVDIITWRWISRRITP